MFSISSVAGAPAQAHTQSTRNGSQATSAHEKPDDPPVVNARQAAERVLRSAVESIEFRETQADIVESEKRSDGTSAQDSENQADRQNEKSAGKRLDVFA